MGAHLPDRIDPKRLDELRVRAGYKSDRRLALAIGVAPDQIGRWKRGESTPSGASVGRLCDLLHTTTDYLFGKDASLPQQKARVLEEVRRLFGRTEADLIEHVSRLTPHHRAILAGRVLGWVEGLEEFERQVEAPRTQFERDLAMLDEQRAATAPAADEAQPTTAPPAPDEEQPSGGLR